MPRRSKTEDLYHQILADPTATPGQKLVAASKIEQAKRARAKARAEKPVDPEVRCDRCEKHLDDCHCLIEIEFPSKPCTVCHENPIAPWNTYCRPCLDKINAEMRKASERGERS
jgi:hypothetical protein